MERVRRTIEARLLARSETDSSGWPSSGRSGASYHTQEGADRARGGAGPNAWHRRQLLGEFHDTARRRGLMSDALLLKALHAFDEAPTHANLCRFAMRLAAIVGPDSFAAPSRSVMQLSDRPSPARGRAGRSTDNRRLGPPHVLPGSARTVEPVRPKPVASSPVAPEAEVPAATTQTYPCLVCAAKVLDVAEHLRRAHGMRRYACPRCRWSVLTKPAESVLCPCGRRFLASNATESLEASTSP